jgi:hypothetical protein
MPMSGESSVKDLTVEINGRKLSDGDDLWMIAIH